MQKNRYLSYLKGILTFIIVYHHMTTALWGKNYFLFKTITTTFAMPLFMAVSGYLLNLSIKRNRNFQSQLMSKIKRVLIPTVIWETLYILLVGITIGGGISFIYGSIWYCYAYLFSSILLLVLIRLFKSGKKLVIASSISIIAVFLIPTDKWFLSWVYPLFVCGYFVGEYWDYIKKNIKIISAICCLAFVVMCFFWKDSYSVYDYGTSFTLHPNCMIHIFRGAISIVGSVTFLWITYLIFKWFGGLRASALIEKVGKESFGIYIIHAYFIAKVIQKISAIISLNTLVSRNLVNIGVAPIVTALVIIMCMVAIIIIRKCRLSMLLLGN